MIKFYLICFLTIPILAISQPNPGSIGTTNLTAWFKADTLTPNTSVTDWACSYPAGISLTPVSSTGPYPTANNFVTGATSNYNTTVDFMGSSDASNLALYYSPTSTLNLLGNSSTTAQGTVFLVYYNPDPNVAISPTGQHMMQYRESNSGGDGIQLRRLSGTNRLAIGSSNNVNATRDFAESFTPTILSYKGNYLNSMAGYQNNFTIPPSSVASASSGAKGLYIGTRRNPTTFEGSYPGFISEILFYDTDLTNEQFSRIHSYLAIKYGITLSNDFNALGSNGNYLNTDGNIVWDAVANPGYHNDVICIGRDDAEALMQKQSHSFSDSVKLYVSTLAATNKDNAGTFSQDKSYVMIGHNNGALCSLNSNAEVPAGQGVLSRIDREWKVTKTNFTDTFSIDITLNPCANVSSINVADLRLLVDNDGDFTNAAAFANGSGMAFSLSGNVLSITGISNNVLSGTAFITIASVNTGTPLPMHLVSFNAAKTDKHQARLTWTAYTNNETTLFTIEKSIDARKWGNIYSITQQAVNSNPLRSFTFIDNEVTKNYNYYRVKAINNAGNTIYSDIKKLVLNGSGNAIKIYPNPAKDVLYIDVEENEIKGLQLYNAQGKNITALISIKNTNQLVKLNISRLPKGVYFINANNQTISFIK